MKNIHRFFISFIVVLTVALFTAFKIEHNAFPETIEWDTHFNAKPDHYSPYAAVTATTWQYSYVTTTRGNQLHIDFKFTAGVVPEKSWVKPKRIRNKEISSALLHHEQGHVYINFLLLKEGELKIRHQKYSIQNYKKLIQANANQVSKKYSNMQSQYDDETKHGSDLDAQSKWDNLLNKELNKYQ